MNIVKMSERALKRGTWSKKDHHNLIVYINKCSIVKRLGEEYAEVLDKMCEMGGRMEKAIESFDNEEDYVKDEE